MVVDASEVTHVQCMIGDRGRARQRLQGLRQYCGLPSVWGSKFRHALCFHRVCGDGCCSEGECRYSLAL